MISGVMTRLRRHNPLAWGTALLVLAYAWAYFRYPDLPGRRAAHPQGWWGWFDQSMTWKSATAFARGDFSPGEHWYPLGYALLGAPFVNPLAQHAFFFVDLASLLAAFLAFCRVAGRFGVPAVWAAALFVAATATDGVLFVQWPIPWNTTPVAALAWVLLACVTSARRGRGVALAAGLVAGLIPVFRPTDAVMVASALGAALAWDGLSRRGRGLAAWVWIVAGGCVPVLAYVCLHLAIYGPHATDYMVQSRKLGFTFHDFLWKASVIFVDPRPWFGQGEGLLHRAPWIALALAGVVPMLLRGRGGFVVVAMLAAHATLYLSYVDLLPTGLWRYYNVHYFVWALPGYALLGFVLVQDLGRSGRPRFVAIGATVVAAALLCLRVDPVPAGPGVPAKMLVFPDLTTGFDTAYFAPIAVHDAAGALANIYDFRAVPAADGLHVIALRRGFAGDVAWVAGQAPSWAPADSPAPTRWRTALRFGVPCWLFPHVCAGG